MYHIPCFYHPGTLVLIDDDLDFLNSLSLVLAPDYKTESFTSALAAQKFLLANNQKHGAVESKYLNVSYESLAEFHVRLEIPKIHKTVYNPKRFEQAVVA